MAGKKKTTVESSAPKLELQEFNPTIAELNKMVLVTKNIVATDLKDKQQMEVVRENRITLKKARVEIEKAGKAYREDANAFLKKVLSKEKELIAIIEPEEVRLKAIEEEAGQLMIREERIEKLPTRKDRLSAIDRGRIPWATDEELLEMDSEVFEAFYNKCVAEHNENVRIQEQEHAAKMRAEYEQKAQQEQAKIDADRKKLEDEKAAIEKDRLDFEHKKEVDAAAAKAREEEQERTRKAAEQARVDAETSKQADTDKKAAEQEKLAKRQEFIKWREDLGYTAETAGDFKLVETEIGYDLFKKLGTFKK